jgi:hypothetical protein
MFMFFIIDNFFVEKKIRTVTPTARTSTTADQWQSNDFVMGGM